MKKSNKTLSSLLLLSLGAFGCGRTQEHAGVDTGQVITVEVETVRREEVPLRYTASGTLRGSQTAVLTSKAPGYVQEIRFEPGDRARAGQVLFVLEDRELGAKLRASRAGVEEARQALVEAENGLKAAEAQAGVATATYERFQTLRDKRAVAPQEYDEVEANYNAAIAQKQMAEARVERVRSALERAEAEVAAVKSYTEITAPFAGSVTERLVDVGNLAAPGAPLGVMERAGGLRAEVSLPESHAGKIRVGDPAEVWLEGAGPSIEGRLSEVHQGVNVVSRTFMARVDLPDELPELAGVTTRPGMFVRVDFHVGRTEAILLPVSAVFQRGQLEMVYVVEDDRARSRLITVGQRRGPRVEVLSGLNEGEVVIAEPSEGLREGVRVVTQ